MTHLALVGPTAAGKSALAFALARELGDVEIISLDSMQVYRGMDIGTAKPDAAERARVNVTRALRTAIDRVTEHDPGLGHHLRTCVRTGTFCAYEPGPDATRWNLGSDS